MSYYTLQRYLEFDDENPEHLARHRAAHSGYLAYIERQKTSNASSVWEIADPFLLDDALLFLVIYRRQKKSLCLKFRCGNIPAGYFDLVFTYEQAELLPESEHVLVTVADSIKSCSRYGGHDCFAHQIVMTDEGLFEHTILFHPGLACIITSSSMAGEMIERKDRRLPRGKCRFSGGRFLTS